MQYTKLVLLALVASIDLGVAQPVKRDPGNVISHPKVVNA